MSSKQRIRHSITPTSDAAKEALLSHCIAGAHPDECWRWNASRKETGYGRIRFMNVEYTASRLSYAVHHGDPGDMDVMHECDNPECCNPRHLMLGSHAENMKDASSKGRWVAKGRGKSRNAGAANGQSKLTDDDVSEIRLRYAAGELQRVLAAEFGVTRSRVSMIVNGKWAGL